MNANPTFFYAHDFVDDLKKVAMKGFKLWYRVAPKSKAGGTWIAQVSTGGMYVRAQSTDPDRAVRLLAKRIVEANRQTAGGARWRKWRGQPWAREVHL